MRFEIFKGRGIHPWYWRARAGNGQITAQSEGYTRLNSAKRAVYSHIDSVGEMLCITNSVKDFIKIIKSK